MNPGSWIALLGARIIRHMTTVDTQRGGVGE